MDTMGKIWIALLLAGAALASDKDDILKQMDARAAHYGDVSKQIWNFAEIYGTIDEAQGAELVVDARLGSHRAA